LASDTTIPVIFVSLNRLKSMSNLVNEAINDSCEEIVSSSDI
jgi:hypothetical protein